MGIVSQSARFYFFPSSPLPPFALQTKALVFRTSLCFSHKGPSRGRGARHIISLASRLLRALG